MSTPVIRKALSIEEIFKADAQERRLYEMREKAFLDEISNVEGAKLRERLRERHKVKFKWLKMLFANILMPALVQSLNPFRILFIQ
jgi:hypothetical protein